MIFLVRCNWWESWFCLDADTFDKRSLQGDVELLQSLQHSDQRVHQRAVLNQCRVLIHLSRDWTVCEQSNPVMQQMVPERRRHNSLTLSAITTCCRFPIKINQIKFKESLPLQRLHENVYYYLHLLDKLHKQLIHYQKFWQWILYRSNIQWIKSLLQYYYFV